MIDESVRRSMRRRALIWLENNVLLLLLLSAAGVVICSVMPYLYGGDFWLNLVAGREIVDNGLPHADRFTVFANGREWVDQQWLANVTFYGLERIGGLTLVSLVGGAIVLLSFGLACAAARWRGASQRATVPVLFLALVSATWGYSVRAQLLVLPLYVACVWLLVDARAGIRPRTFLVVPITVVWANLHGSVLLVMTLTAWLAVADATARRWRAWPGAPLLALLSAAAVLVTPYGPVDTVQYYRLLVVDPPFADLIVEWQRPGLNALTAPFWLLAASTVVLVGWQWRRLTVFELGALGLTLAGAISAVRGVIWFTLLVVVVLPVVVDGAFRLHDAKVNPRLNRVIAGLACSVVVISIAVVAARGDDWPTDILPALERETRAASTRVWGTDLTADWLLWHQPDLAGRIAYDVRFELLTRGQIRAIGRYNAEAGENWIQIADGFDVVVVDSHDEPSHLDDFRAEPGTRVVYSGDRASLVVRGP
jgi:hypothetical protein